MEPSPWTAEEKGKNCQSYRSRGGSNDLKLEGGSSKQLGAIGDSKESKKINKK